MIFALFINSSVMIFFVFCQFIPQEQKNKLTEIKNLEKFIILNRFKCCSSINVSTVVHFPHVFAR